LGKLAATVMKNETIAVRLAGQEYANDVKAIAPYKTGTYRRSIHVEMSTEGLHPVALIGTDVPYGRRLEFGFYDTDSLGRKYQQYPRPHWRPAWDANLQKYRDIMLSHLNGTQAGTYADYGTEKRAEVAMYSRIAAGLRPDLTDLGSYSTSSASRSLIGDSNEGLVSMTIKGMSGINEGTKHWKPYSGKSKGEKLQ
jgi:hypothetical protein